MTNHEYLNHAWNIARIGSLYYGIDTTWDVQSGYTAENRPHSYRYCLRGTDFWYVGHSLGTGYRSMGDKYSEPGFAAAYPLSAGDYVPGNAAVYAIRYHHAEGVDNPNPSCYNDATPLVLCEVSKPGYQFYGWYDNEGCRGASVPFIPAGASGEKDFYACFMPVSYLIRFDGNGADSGSVTSRTAYYDESISLPEGGFVRRGYHFTGWNTAADGKGTDYEPGETVVNLNNGEPLTLYAKWEKGSRFPESGDTNGDGMVNGADVSLLARYVKAKGQGVTLSPSSGDTNGDGLHNGADIILLARYLLAKGHEITAE